MTITCEACHTNYDAPTELADTAQCPCCEHVNRPRGRLEKHEPTRLSLENTAEDGDRPRKTRVSPDPVASRKTKATERASRSAESSEPEVPSAASAELEKWTEEAAESEIRAMREAERTSRATEAAESESRATEAAGRARRAAKSAESETRAAEAAERARRAAEAAETETRAAEAAERPRRAADPDDADEVTRPRPKGRPRAAAPVVRLTVVEDGQLPRQYVVDRERVVLGRGKCDVKVSDPEVSREHCAIETRDGVPTLRDLKSANGTVLNGHLVNEHALKDGDRIAIGATMVEVSVAMAA
jgi:hypothetical protein